MEKIKLGLGVSKVLLDGLYDEESPLIQLRGCQHIMRRIWMDVVQYWKVSVTHPQVIEVDQNDWDKWGVDDFDDLAPQPFFLNSICSVETPISFPEPDEENPIQINMMPFFVGRSFSDCYLPEIVKPYWELIKVCLEPEYERKDHHLWPAIKIPSELGNVWYLTIDESLVKPEESQRRPGLHVDSAGEVKIKNNNVESLEIEGRGDAQHYSGHRWGRGCCHMVFKDTEKGRFGLIRNIRQFSAVH